MTQDETPVMYNPFMPGFTDDPYPHYRAMRESAPVQHTPLGLWLLCGYDDVVRILRDPGLSVEDRNAGTTVLRQRSLDVLGQDSEQHDGLAMLNRDPPDHTRLRRLVSKAFTPRTVEMLRPRIQALVDAALDDAEQRGGMELIGDFAYPLPFQVISDLLGVPDADVSRLRRWSGLIVRSLEPVLDERTLRSIGLAGTAMFRLIHRVIAFKRENPADDLISALIAAEDDGDVLSHDELAQQVALIYIAGHETTVNLIGNGIAALLQYPDQLRDLRDDPSLLPNAIEELLRYDSPIQSSRRITLEPLQVGERTIETGAFVVLSLGAANRDPARFGDDADQLDIRRPDASAHVSFGGGHHHCLGAALARLEGQIVIGGLLERFAVVEAAGEPVWNGRINFRGLDSLPLRLG